MTASSLDLGVLQGARAFRDAWPRLPALLARRTTMRAALLVAPDAFAIAAESAADNRYMALGAAADRERARAQHEALARLLRALGVPTLVLPGVEGQPDGVFPNNAFAFTEGRRLILGNMRHAVRRRETERADVRALFCDAFGYELVDLSAGRAFCELTGSLVIDHARAIGYCGTSARADHASSVAMHEAFGLRATLELALAPSEYHTNVVLSILAGRACVVHRASFIDAEVAAAVAAQYATLELDDAEKAAFAGNSLAITERDVLFSATSLAALRPSSRRFLEEQGFRVHGAAVDELEKAGGSLRCLIAEIF